MTYFNRKTRITTSVIGVLLGLAGIFNHGLFEILQGNQPTNGFYIDAIGEAHRFWIHGTEAAITVVRNFLITGILAVLVGLVIIVWSLRYLQKKNGVTIFLALLILLTLVGGGIGHIVLFVPTFAFARQINRSLDFWQQELPERLRKKLSALWIYGLITTSFAWLILMELGIFGYFPGISNPDAILNVVYVFLFSSVFFASITFICAFAGDIKERKHY